MKAIFKRLAKLEQVDTGGGIINRIVGAFRLIGSSKGVLRVPVVKPGAWNK
jgi:hypothetical protein